MPQTRINIIGASGTGKTTLGKALSEHIRVPHFDSDVYFNLPTDPPFMRQRDADERHAMIMNDLEGRRAWILSGAVAGWQPTPQLDYTLVVFLYLPPEIRLERLRQRERQLYGARILRDGDMEFEHQSFMDWTAGYDSGKSEGFNTLARHETFVKELDCKVLRLEKPMTPAAQIQLIVESLGL